MNTYRIIMSRVYYSVIIILFLLTACTESTTTKPTSSPTLIEPSPSPTLTSTPIFSLDIDAEYQIYDAFLNSRLFSSPIIIVVNETNFIMQLGINEIELARDRLPETGDEVWENFLNRNDKVYHVEARFALDEAEVMLVSRDYINNFFDDELDLDLMWQNFNETHPDSYGFITLSRVGVNVAMDEAIIYFERHCGGLCGSGGYALLTKYHGLWWVEDWVSLWNA